MLTDDSVEDVISLEEEMESRSSNSSKTGEINIIFVGFVFFVCL